MLNLLFAMQRHQWWSENNFHRLVITTPLWGIVVCLLFLLYISLPAAAQTDPGTPQVTIQSPKPGDALQGVVSINGITDWVGFRSAEVAFAYQSDSTQTWFLIQQSTTPVKDGLLANWDTTTISDGEYQLRLQVILEGGQVLETVVRGLRVRNYTQVETITPAAQTTGIPAVQNTPTPPGDFQPRAFHPTVLPTNPAQITAQSLRSSAAQGIMVVLVALVVGSLYIGIRALFRR